MSKKNIRIKKIKKSTKIRKLKNSIEILDNQLQMTNLEAGWEIEGSQEDLRIMEEKVKRLGGSLESEPASSCKGEKP